MQQPDPLSATFAALADPTRRAILARLATGEASVTELAAPFDMSQPAVSKHLRVLERAGLIEQGRQAQWRPRRLRAEPLRDIAAWVDQYRRHWDESFERLDDYLREVGSDDAGTDTEVRSPIMVTITERFSNDTTTVYSEDAELVWERVFDAPREVVWQAFMDPERIPLWWGPHGSTATVVEMDVRPGGTWRFISRAPGREDVPFTGQYLELDPPASFRQTFIVDVDGMRDQVGVEHYTFEDIGDRTRLTSRAHFGTVDALEGALSTGMIAGGVETWDRFAAMLGAG